MFGLIRGRRFRPSPLRRLVMELMHHAQKIPLIPLSKHCNIRPTLYARNQLLQECRWPVIWMRAFAIVASKTPALRQMCLTFPTTTLYEHPRSECAVIIGRNYNGERGLFTATIASPETTTLADLNRQLDRLCNEPVESICTFRESLTLGRMPWLLRRLIFWTAINVSGSLRARRIGTFMISSLGMFGVEQRRSIAPMTTYLSFGPISEDGSVQLHLIYDHRVMDGPTAAKALQDIESTMRTQMTRELEDLARTQRIRGAA